MVESEPTSPSIPAERGDRLARGLRAFLANPYLNLIKAVLLLLIGISEASATLTEDVQERRLRVGHGLLLIGFFGVLEAVPRLLEAREAQRKYLRARRAHRNEASVVEGSRGSREGSGA